MEEKRVWGDDLEDASPGGDDNAAVSVPMLQRGHCLDGSREPNLPCSPSMSSTSTAVSDRGEYFGWSSPSAAPLVSRSAHRGIRFSKTVAQNCWPAFCWVQFIIALYICNWPFRAAEADDVWGLRYITPHQTHRLPTCSPLNFENQIIDPLG